MTEQSGIHALEAAAGAVSVEEVERLVKSLISDARCGTILNAIRRIAAPQAKDGVREAAQAYLTALDTQPEKDCWDTETGEEEPGAQKFPSDWSWADWHDRKDKALVALRAALKSPANPEKPGQEGEGSDGWQPIETAPKDGAEVLILTSLGAHISAKWDQKDHEWTEGRLGLGFEKDLVTHWRPLPAPPSPAPQHDGEPEVGA